MIMERSAVSVVLGVFLTMTCMGSAQAAVSYAPPTSFSTTNSPEFIAQGQLNGDANMDLVSVNDAVAPALGSITVLLSNGAGGFTTSSYAVGAEPRQVAIGDLNGDTYNDLVVTNSDPDTVATAGNGSLTVLLNNGSGVFTEASYSPIDIEVLTAGATAEPSSVVIAQLNSSTDAFPDIAVANDTTNNVQILLGVSGSTSFTDGGIITVGAKPISMAAGSINTNTDALTDLVVGNLTDGTVSVLLGNGTGGFANASGSPFAAGGKPFSVHIASINNITDTIPDIALVNYSSTLSKVKVFPGVGDGTFTSVPSVTVAGKPHSVEVADVDADGDADLVVASDNSASSVSTPAAAVNVLLGDGIGSFTAAQYPLSGTPNSALAINLDNANQLDLAVANGSGNMDVLLSVPTTFAPAANDGFLQVTTAANGTTAVQSGTLSGTDADGALLRYAVSSQGTNGTVAITNEATGAYTYTPLATGFAPDNFQFTVDDGTGPSAAGTIQVVQNDAAPVITSDGGGATAAIGANENQTAVTTVTATDADTPAQTLTYSISGGADMAKFNISSGVLTFASAPNFEAPTDSGANNVYDVQVQVADGNGGLDVQDIAVTVADVNEAPVITSNGNGCGCRPDAFV